MRRIMAPLLTPPPSPPLFQTAEGRKGEGEGGAIATLGHHDFSLIIAVTLTFI